MQNYTTSKQEKNDRRKQKIVDIIYNEMELWTETLSDAQIQALAKSIINK